MKFIISIFFSFFFGVINAQVDTLYYDMSFNKVNIKEFASYFRVLPKNVVKGKSNNFRDYYITGELLTDGHFIDYDSENAAKIKYDGFIVSYYRNGRLKAKSSYKQGIIDGEDVGYSEEGLMTHHAFFINGKINGIYTEFSSNGEICTQTQFSYGEPAYNYKVISNNKGQCSIVNLENDKPVYISPTYEERKTEFLNGAKWLYYNKNGIMVGMTEKRVYDYGKYYKINIAIRNNSLFPINFEPTKTTAMLVVDKKKAEKDLHVYPVGEYINKVKNRQGFALAMASLAEGLASYNAGKSSSTTSINYSGNISDYDNSINYNGTINASTSSYNGLAAYQANVIAENRLAQYKESMVSECNIKEEGYLKATTIHPGETLNGYINIEGKHGLGLIITLKIGDADYVYKWNVSGED